MKILSSLLMLAFLVLLCLTATTAFFKIKFDKFGGYEPYSIYPVPVPVPFYEQVQPQFVPVPVPVIVKSYAWPYSGGFTASASVSKFGGLGGFGGGGFVGFPPYGVGFSKHGGYFKR